MASHHQLLSIPLFFLLLLPSALAATFFLPIFKTTDLIRNQYHSKLQIGTPPVPVTLTIDVNNAFTWLACDRVGYNRSSTYSAVHCHSPDCIAFSGDGFCFDCNDTSTPTPSCNANQCASGAFNPILDKTATAIFVRDSATILRRVTPSSSPALTTLPRLPFLCALLNDNLFKGMSQSSDGILSLARTPSAIQSLVSSTFNVARKFAVCLPSSTTSNGAVYFGGGPYSVSNAMVSLPLLLNANISDNLIDEPSFAFYVNVVSIEIDRVPLVFNSSLLSVDSSTGDGGTLVSPITSYGQLRPQIFKPFVELFVAKAKARNVKTVTPVRKEFGACFDANSIHYDPKTGSGLPVIDLVAENKAKWRIFGSNSVVAQRGGMSCLAFVEGKPFREVNRLQAFPAVVIGGTLMEDNLVEFDPENSRLGVTSSLLRLGTSCSNFKGV